MDKQYAVIEIVLDGIDLNGKFRLVKDTLTAIQAHELKTQLNTQYNTNLFAVTMIPEKNQQPLFKEIY